MIFTYRPYKHFINRRIYSIDITHTHTHNRMSHVFDTISFGIRNGREREKSVLVNVFSVCLSFTMVREKKWTRVWQLKHQSRMLNICYGNKQNSNTYDVATLILQWDISHSTAQSHQSFKCVCVCACCEMCDAIIGAKHYFFWILLFWSVDSQIFDTICMYSSNNNNSKINSSIRLKGKGHYAHMQTFLHPNE